MQGGGNWASWALYYGAPIALTKLYGGVLQGAKYITEHAGTKGYEKTRMQITKYEKSRLQDDFVRTEEPGYRIEEFFRSLVAPLLRGW